MQTLQQSQLSTFHRNEVVDGHADIFGDLSQQNGEKRRALCETGRSYISHQYGETAYASLSVSPPQNRVPSAGFEFLAVLGQVL